MFANYRAVKAVVMRTFNQNRFHIVTQHYLRNNSAIFLEPIEANRQEPVLAKVTRYFRRIDIGTRLKAERSGDGFSDLTSFQLKQLQTDKFCVKFDSESNKNHLT